MFSRPLKPRPQSRGAETREKIPMEVLCSPENAAMQREAQGRFARLIERVRNRIIWARIKLVDVRDESGALLKRCVVQMRLRHSPQVVFAVTAASAREAIEGAVQRLQRVLERRMQQATPAMG